MLSKSTCKAKSRGPKALQLNIIATNAVIM